MPGQVQYWIFTRLLDTQAAGPLPPFTRVASPATVCLAPTDPAVTAAVDPLLLIPGLVEQEFQRVVVLRAVPVVQPTPDTLVNIPTRFRTSSTERYDIPLTLLGHAVVITAQAESWTWQFGDGSSQSVTAKGTGGRTTHEYRATGAMTARVDIIWSGTFSIDGGPERPVAGRATTVGQPVTSQVKQARAVLVAH